MKFKQYLSENQLNEASVKVGTFIGWNEKSIGERAGGVVVAKIDGGYIVYQGPSVSVGALKHCVDDSKRCMGNDNGYANGELTFMSDSLNVQSEFYKGTAKAFKSQDELLSWLEDY